MFTSHTTHACSFRLSFSANQATGRHSGPRAKYCSECIPGFHAPTRGLENCLGCLSGKAASNFGTVNCSKCEPGTISAPRAHSCSKCTPGWYASAAGSQQCSQCAAGKYVNVSGATVCSDCAPGKAQGGTGQTKCIDCSLGTFTDIFAKAACTSCRGDTTTDETGSTACERCIKGFYWSQEDECHLCSSDSTWCGLNGFFTYENLFIREGHWRPTPTSIGASIEPCPFPEACTCPTDKNKTVHSVTYLTGKREVQEKLRYINDTNDPLFEYLECDRLEFADGGDSYCNNGYTGPLCVSSSKKFRSSSERTHIWVDCSEFWAGRCPLTVSDDMGIFMHLNLMFAVVFN